MPARVVRVAIVVEDGEFAGGDGDAFARHRPGQAKGAAIRRHGLSGKPDGLAEEGAGDIAYGVVAADAKRLAIRKAAKPCVPDRPKPRETCGSMMNSAPGQSARPMVRLAESVFRCMVADCILFGELKGA